jgi:hypothetical protein
MAKNQSGSWRRFDACVRHRHATPRTLFPAMPLFFVEPRHFRLDGRT